MLIGFRVFVIACISSIDSKEIFKVVIQSEVRTLK